MSVSDSSCHGQFDSLHAGSAARPLKRTFKAYQKVRSYVVWHLENMGLAGTLRHALVRTRQSCGLCQAGPEAMPEDATGSLELKALNLAPGEWVEVKSVDEILATLDANRRHRGLLWMTGMRKFCNKKYRVYKRLERILLESNGELRTMKNTVILEGVMCDGSEFGGCDRSCFHFWREAWLSRTDPPGQTAAAADAAERSTP